MEKLTRSQLWERVKKLDKKIVWSIQHRKPSMIVSVTDEEIKRETKDSSSWRPSSSASIQEVYNTYSWVWDHKIMTGKDFDRVPGAIHRVVMARSS